MANADYYLQQKIFEQDVLYRDEALNTNMEKVDMFKKTQEYIAELKLMCKPHSWCSMVAFFGLASVLHRPVESLFPNTGSEFMNRIYNCVIMPRQNPHYYPPCIIMWSSLSATSFQNSGKSNHFVPVFKKKSSYYDSNLPQFLEKTIPKDLLSSSFQDNYINLAVDEVESNNNNNIITDEVEFNNNNNIITDELESNNNIITENENYDEVQNNIIGLFMGVDNKYIPNIDKLDGYLIYPEAKDFQFTISQEEASSLFIYNIENCNYHWRPWQISNYYLVELLKGQSEFPPQISISVLKTSETNKNLIKYCYCGGCDKKNQTLFRIIINNIDLIQSKEFVKINVIYSTNKRQCRHLDGKIFGQCRGYARQVLSRSVEFKSPRQMRKKILSNVKNEVRYTGNRQGIPSAHSARTIYSEKEKNESGYNLCERLHAAIGDINGKEKDDYIKINGADLVNKRRLWGFIQEPIQTQPLSVMIFNEAGITYYHYNVNNNPGIFLDYTGQLVKPVPQYLTPLNNSNNKRILNAFFTMPSNENSSDAPPVDVFELVTNDLSSKNLQRYLHIYRQKELELFNSNSVPFLINTDCARNLLVAILEVYNNESVDQYITRIMNTIINKEEFDNSKVLIGWCFGHAIRAIRHHVRSKKFMIESGYDREIISKFAMRIWNAVRVKENILDAEKEIEKWEWVMNQKYLKLINKDIKLAGRKILTENFDVTVIPDLLIHMDSDCFDLSSSIGENIYNNPMCISNLLNQEQENLWTYRLDNNILLKILCDENKNFRLLVPQLGITVDAQLSPFDSIKNPFYSLNLINYLDKVWWKTIVLWSNLVPAIKNRTRRTTATVEVENHIVKNLDIGKKNLPIDQYLYVRTQTLKSTQNLIAETLMRNSKIHKTSNDLYEQWQPKKKKVFSKEEINIINDFKTVMEYRKGLDAPSQSRIAREIREISTVQIGFNQSMVSRILNNVDIPKCDKTLTAIIKWINLELEKREKNSNSDK
ncbi:hypothetical protein GLOIN_2v1835524 [Rhizophagus irregularis DAOM 181602=DAOM 197198]|nr:hypothetical protein GLOIN_2v1835524 [Rhizophagus irregularis DAOM 181602=DAOM 197198]